MSPIGVVVDGYAGATAADARAAVADGADVVVVQAKHDRSSGRTSSPRRGQVPVVAVDRFVAGADWFVSYDRSLTGVAVADAVAARLGGRGPGAGPHRDLGRGRLRCPRAGAARRSLGSRHRGGGGGWTQRPGRPTEARDWVGDLSPEPTERAAGRRGPRRQRRAGRWHPPGVRGAPGCPARGRWSPGRAATGGGTPRGRRGNQTLTVHMPVARTAESAADVALAPGPPAATTWRTAPTSTASRPTCSRRWSSRSRPSPTRSCATGRSPPRRSAQARSEEGLRRPRVPLATRADLSPAQLSAALGKLSGCWPVRSTPGRACSATRSCRRGPC